MRTAIYCVSKTGYKTCLRIKENVYKDLHIYVSGRVANLLNLEKSTVADYENMISTLKTLFNELKSSKITEKPETKPNTEDKEKGIKRIETYYVVKTDGGNIDFMYLQVVAKDDEDPDEIGISSMMYSPEIWQITMDDSNRGHYLWVDNPFWADFVQPDDVMTTESSR